MTPFGNHVWLCMESVGFSRSLLLGLLNNFAVCFFPIETQSLWNGLCSWEAPNQWRCWRPYSVAWYCSDHIHGLTVWLGLATTGTPSILTTSGSYSTTSLPTRYYCTFLDLWAEYISGKQENSPRFLIIQQSQATQGLVSQKNKLQFCKRVLPHSFSTRKGVFHFCFPGWWCGVLFLISHCRYYQGKLYSSKVL